ncbi:MAG: site-specific integrase, partial [Clostridia bacterium]|nr:site-specific integrase [Clostridia bacterium]
MADIAAANFTGNPFAVKEILPVLKRPDRSLNRLLFLYAVLKKLGWEDRNYTCHSFRKYFGCTQYLAHPDDMPRLAAIMGHSSLSSTMVYIRLAAAFKAAM